MSTEIDIYSGSSLEDRKAYAGTVAAAKAILPTNLRGANEADTAARAFLIMETGAMLGLHPMAALAGVNVIEGKPALSSGLMSAVIRAAGHKLHVSESGTIEGGDYKATATLTREDDPEHPFVSIWTPHRAQRAGLCKYEAGADGVWRVTAVSQQGKPLPWQNYTESLCKSRTISEVARDGAQDVLLGMRYTDEELENGAAEFGGELATVEDTAKPERKTPARGRQGAKRKAAPVDMTPAEPEPTPEPAEDIVDADVVEEPSAEQDAAEMAEQEEQARRAAEAAEAEARYREAEEAPPAPEVTPEAVAKLRAAKSPDALPGESEVEYQQRKLAEKATAKANTAENEARPFVDTYDGATYATQEELDAVLAARVKAKQAERAAQESEAPSEPQAGPTPYEVAKAEEPENYERQEKAATTEEELRDLYNRAGALPGGMPTQLRLAIMQHKARLAGPLEAQA